MGPSSRRRKGRANMALMGNFHAELV